MTKEELNAMRDRTGLVAALFQVDATDFDDTNGGRVFIHGWVSADSCRELANAIDGKLAETPTEIRE